MSLVIYVFVPVCISKGVYVSIGIEWEEWEVVWLPPVPLSNFCGLTTTFSYFHKYKGMVKQWIL